MIIPLESLLAFFGASLLLALAPGPDNLFVVTQSMVHGVSAGLSVVLGLCTGLLVHSAAVALGVAVIFQTSAVAFSILKFVGAGYLVYLAWRSFRASPKSVGGDSGPTMRRGRLYLRGIFMNVTNPKVSLFFLAFLPQFTSPTAGSIPWQMVLLGAVFMIQAAIIFTGIALFAGTAGRCFLQRPGVSRYLHWAAAGVFAALALRLLVVSR